MLSEFNVNNVGLNVLLVPMVNWIGIVFAENSCEPVPEKVKFKSVKLYTSI